MTVAEQQPLLRERLDRDGWMSFPAVVETELLEQIAVEAETAGDNRGGLRDLLNHSSATRRLARHPGIRQIAEAAIGTDCFVTRAILFDKTQRANWKVPWHQDLTIAVRERKHGPGFGAWSVKAGIVHVQPPAEVLERMLAVRVHLDECGPQNGPVRVLPGSHQGGRLTAADIEARRKQIAAVDCPVPRGGVLIFRPLILHASSPATVPSHRRVVHFEFAVGGLPEGLQWHSQI